MKKMTIFGIHWAILAGIIGTALSLYAIHYGSKQSAANRVDEIKEKIDSSEINLINEFNNLDSIGRAKFIDNAKLNKEEIITQINNQTVNSATEIIEEVQDKFGLIEKDLGTKTKQINSLEFKAKKQISKTNEVISKLEDIKSEDEFSDEKIQDVIEEIKAGYVRYFKGEKGCIAVVPNLAYPNSHKIAENLNLKLIEKGFNSQVVGTSMTIPQREKSAEIYNKSGQCMTLLVNFK